MPKFTIKIIQSILLFAPFLLAIVIMPETKAAYASLILPTAVCFGMAAILSVLQSIDEKLGS